MRTTYFVITILSAVMNGSAAVLNFAGAESVKAIADRLHIPQRWMRPFGVILAIGAAGLVLGIVVPWLGGAAAAGLIAYFSCAVIAHLRVRDTHFGGALLFLLLAAAALAINFIYRHPW